MANKRIHDLDDTATTLDSGAYIAVDSDSYTAAKKFAADTLPDPTGATDGYVWTADGANGAAWEAVAGGAGDVTDLTTTTGSSTNMVRVAAAGGLEYRTTAQVLSDIGADPAGSAAAAIAALGGANATLTDGRLKEFALAGIAYATSVTETDYTQSWVDVFGVTQYAGWVQVRADLLFPDGSTGHLDGVKESERGDVLWGYTVSHTDSGKIAVVSPLILGSGSEAVTVKSPDYYIDSTAAGGGDGSLATPYNAFSDLPALSSGDIVALKSGSTFFEKFPFATAVEIYRYGPGAQPIGDARATVAAGDWSLYGAGAGSTYQASITWEGSGSGESVDHLAVFVDDTRATLGGSAAGLSAGQYYIANASTGSGTLYVRASDDGDLSAGAHVVKHASIHGAFNAQSAGMPINCVIDGVTGIANTGNGGSIKIGTGGILRNCTAYDGTAHNIYVRDGCTVRGCVAERAYNAGSSLTLFVYNEDTPASAGVSFSACTAKLDAIEPLSVGWFGHKNISGDFGTVNIDHCYGETIAVGYNVGDLSAITFERNVGVSCTVGYRAGFAGTHTLINSYLNNGSSAGKSVDVSTGMSPGSTLTLKNCYLTGSNIQGGSIYIAVNTTVNVYRCVLYLPGGVSGNATNINVTSAASSSALSVFDSALSGAYRYYDLYTSTLAANGNKFSADAGQRWRVGGTDYTSFANYKTGTSQDLLSRIGGIA